MPMRIPVAASAALFAVLLASPALAEPIRVDINSGMAQPLPIAVPGFAATAAQTTEAGSTAELGGRVAQVIANDLKSSGLFRPIDPQAYHHHRRALPM